MSASPEEVTANPGPAQVADDDDALDLALATKQSTTIREVQREIALGQAKHKLGITQAEWLRLQQEILKFLKHMEGQDRTNEDAAVAFLNETGAKDRFFGLLAGGEAEGMLVNRAGLAWGIDDDQIIPQIAAIVAAWRPIASSYNGCKVQVLEKRSTEQFDNDDPITTTKRKLNPKVLAMLPAEIVKSCGVTAAQYEEDNSLFVDDDQDTQDTQRQRRDEKFNPKVLAMLPADIVKSCGVTAAQYEESNSLFDDDDQNTQSQRRNETAIISREAMHHKTRPVSTQVQTALAPKNDHKQRALPLPQRPTSFTLDMCFREAEPSLTPVVPSAPQPWLKVSLYVGGERKVRGHKLLMVERITSLASFNSQVFNAYYWQLEGTRRNLHEDSIRCYIVHYGIGGSGNVARIEAHDDRAWKAALDTLQTVGEAGRVVLRGCVEVHL